MIPAMIVPILTRPDLLYRLLGTIDEPVGDIVIIDNGRCVDDLPPVEMASRVHVLRMPTNLGVAASWNLGVKSLPFAPWWLIVNFDTQFPRGSLARFAEIKSGGVVLSHGSPPWCCFALHDEAVRQAGLFDESFHPAYFEDWDYARRVAAAGLPVVETDIPIHHDNSSTVANYPNRNEITFGANERYYQGKIDAHDYTAGAWSIQRRRELSWD